jgi:hypothetical protein
MMYPLAGVPPTLAGRCLAPNTRTWILAVPLVYPTRNPTVGAGSSEASLLMLASELFLVLPLWPIMFFIDVIALSAMSDVQCGS